MTLLRTTVLVDAPPRVVSATLTERSLFGDTGVLAPGDEISFARGHFRVAETTADELRLVLAAGPSLELHVRLAPTAAGVLVTVTARSRAAWPGLALRRPLLDLLTTTAHRIRARATTLARARVVVGAAIVRGRAVLAQQRAYPASAAGRWELPGGRVEPVESDVDAVRRECVEELGVHIGVGEPIGPDVALPKDMLLRVYRAELTEPDAVPHPHDHQALRWLTAGRLGTVEWLPADRVLLPALRRLLRPAPLADPRQPQRGGQPVRPALGGDRGADLADPLQLGGVAQQFPGPLA